jgi:hypothetical protein
MSRFSRTAQQLAMVRRDSPLDRDARSTPVMEVIDVFYVSDDPTLNTGRNGTFDFDGTPNVEDSRTRSAFDDPTISQLQASDDPAPNGGFYRHRVYPILRPDDEAAAAPAGPPLRYVFGWRLLGEMQEAREVLVLETTRVVLRKAGDGTQALVNMRLNATGPGGVAGTGGAKNARHHHLIASATFREPVGGLPNTNRAILFTVETATGFWARATNVSMILFDDPAHPNYLARELSVLRGIGPS